MKHCVVLLVALAHLQCCCHGLDRRFRRGNGDVTNNDSAIATELYLTPLIESGKLAKAKQLSKVNLKDYNGDSYSGFLTVNKKFGSNMFFWFFPSQSDANSAPVALWLQGGPGGSSMFGLFVEHGPFSVDERLQLVPRNLSWNKHISMLYIDNPVGTGFSFTGHDQGYATNQKDVANDLYSALSQFFKLFHEYASNEFYITGESYAGKYIPSISYKIHLENQKPHAAKINFKGMAIGDGLVDPPNMLNYGSFLHSIGLIDSRQRQLIERRTAEVAHQCQLGNHVKAFELWDTIVNGDKTRYPTYYANFTGFTNYFNYLYPTDPWQAVPYEAYLNGSAVRQAIHVGRRAFGDGHKVEEYLLPDIMVSVAPLVGAVLDAGYRTLIYSGQLDVIVAYQLTQNWLQRLAWNGTGRFLSAPRHQWRHQPAPDAPLLGYWRRVDNLYEVMVRNAGHMLPSDQPDTAYHLINSFINRRSLFA